MASLNLVFYLLRVYKAIFSPSPSRAFEKQTFSNFKLQRELSQEKHKLELMKIELPKFQLFCIHCMDNR